MGEGAIEFEVETEVEVEGKVKVKVGSNEGGAAEGALHAVGEVTDVRDHLVGGSAMALV